MSELNAILNGIQKKSSKIKDDLIKFLKDYELLYSEANGLFMSERLASNGSTDGLEDFYRLLQIIKRNRDVASSLVRGVANVRPMNEFKFIEEDIEAQSADKKKPGRPKKEKKFNPVIEQTVQEEAVEV